MSLTVCECEQPEFVLDREEASSTIALIEELKEADQDHEFYPTTNEIIQRMIRDLRSVRDEHHNRALSFLDIGAGNGKVLAAVKGATYEMYKRVESLTCGELYAIEKSTILCQQLDPEILIIGTDFEQQTLFSKQVDVTFCNPPYRQYEAWCDKIIRQSASKWVYLVIPQRWERSTVIADALKWRGVKTKKLGDYDFEDAEDRQARAKVHLLRLDMPEGDDAFDRFFEQEFKDLYDKFGTTTGAKSDDDESTEPEPPKEEDTKAKFGKLVPGPSYPEALVAMYNAEMANVQNNYKLVSQLDASLLKEFGLEPHKVMACLKQRLTGMKLTYWTELFSRLDKITERLTSKTRSKMIDTLNKHTSVDFTYNNILAVVIWVINNANIYLESQLLDVYDEMVEKANVRMYKSNKRVWEEERWRYTRDERDKLYTHYALDYRIVTSRLGGVSNRWEWSKPALTEEAANFLGDLMTIARNLGFNHMGHRGLLDYHNRDKWVPGQTEVFYLQDGEQLMDVKGFKNRNLHIRLNKDFICALNVEHGRLKGWLRNAQEAVTELDDPKAAQYFQVNHRLELNPRLMLTQ